MGIGNSKERCRDEDEVFALREANRREGVSLIAPIISGSRTSSSGVSRYGTFQENGLPRTNGQKKKPSIKKVAAQNSCDGFLTEVEKSIVRGYPLKIPMTEEMAEKMLSEYPQYEKRILKILEKYPPEPSLPKPEAEEPKTNVPSCR